MSQKKYTLDEFLLMKQTFFQGEEQEKFEIIGKVRKASSLEENPPLELIRKSELIPVLMKYYQENDLPDPLIQDILWICTNVASGNSEDTLYIVKLKGIDFFIDFLHHKSEPIWAQALWGLANLAGESSNLRDKLLEKDVLRITLEIYSRLKKTMKTETRRTVAWMINNLCRNKPPVSLSKVKDSIPYIYESLRDLDDDVVIENLWACAYISEISDQGCKALLDADVISVVTNVFMNNIDSVKKITPSLRTFSNFVSGNDNLTEKILGLGVIPSILQLFESKKSAVRREVCFFFSNIAAGTQKQITYIFQFPNLISMLEKIIQSDEQNIVLEAIWVVTNSLMGGNQDHVRKIIDSEIYLEIFRILPHLDVNGILVVLEGLRELFNHTMDFLDTPKKLVKLYDIYRCDIEDFVKNKYDPMLESVIQDINDILDDLEEYIEPQNNFD